MLKRTASGDALGSFEPELTMQYLPGCKECGSPHPLALKGQHDPNICPGCGALAGLPGPVRVEKAVLGGLYGLVARGLFWIGQKLSNLVKE